MYMSLNPSTIDHKSLLNQILYNELIYVVDKHFKVVYANEKAIEFFQQLNNSSGTPNGTICYESFRKRDKQCENCYANDFFSSLENKPIKMPDFKYNSTYNQITFKRYEENGEIYVIHHLIKSDLLGWMIEYSEKVINSIKEAVVVTDLNGIIISVNKTFEKKMGYTKQEVIGTSNENFYLNQSEAFEFTEKIKSLGKYENNNINVKTKYGTIRNIEISGYLLKKGEGNFIVRVSKFLEMNEILKSIINITESITTAYEPEKLTYLIVKETARLLDSRYCSLYLVSDDNTRLELKAAYDDEYMKHAKDIYYELNWDEKDESKMDGITSMVALKEKEFNANSWDEIEKHPAHAGKLNLVYDKLSNKNTFINMFAIPLFLGDVVRGVFRIESKLDGSDYSNVDIETFELMGTYLMLVLEEQNRLKKTLLEHIAHLTKSPIAVCIVNLTLLSNENSLKTMSNHEIAEVMRIIKNALLQANMTITNLIVWSANSERTAEATVKEINIIQLVLKITRSFEAFIPNIRFKTKVQGSLPLSIPDQVKLEIVLQNVIHNSIKYSNQIYNNIIIIGKKHNDHYEITIRDHGIGIPKKDMLNIWKPFHKGENVAYDSTKYGSVRGIGIGLPSVKKICNESGWVPDISSEEGHGTLFSLKILLGRYYE